MRNVVRSGILGALPGLLIAVVPLVLYEFDVLTSDQSQIGFIGIPVMVIGVFVGIARGASNSPSSGKAMVGAALGFVAGIAAGIGIDEALLAMGSGTPGMWLFLAPVGAVVGAVIGVWRGEHGTPRRPASQH